MYPMITLAKNPLNEDSSCENEPLLQSYVDDCTWINSSTEGEHDDNDLDEQPRLLPVMSNSDDDDDDDQEVTRTRRRTSETKAVRFDTVQVREHSVTVGDHPLCTDSLPITLDWDHSDEEEIYSIDAYEDFREFEGRGNVVRLSLWRRRQLLRHVGGISDQDLDMQSPSARLSLLQIPQVELSAPPQQLHDRQGGKNKLSALNDDFSTQSIMPNSNNHGFPPHLLEVKILEN